MTNTTLTGLITGNINGILLNISSNYKLLSGFIFGPSINLSGKNLSNIDLSNTNLTNANLTNANLSNANLLNIIIENTNLLNVNLIRIITEELYGGGARGGKSWFGCTWQLMNRLSMPESYGCIAREEVTKLKKTTLLTFFKVCNRINYGLYRT